MYVQVLLSLTVLVCLSGISAQQDAGELKIQLFRCKFQQYYRRNRQNCDLAQEIAEETESSETESSESAVSAEVTVSSRKLTGRRLRLCKKHGSCEEKNEKVEMCPKYCKTSNRFRNFWNCRTCRVAEKLFNWCCIRTMTETPPTTTSTPAPTTTSTPAPTTTQVPTTQESTTTQEEIPAIYGPDIEGGCFEKCVADYAMSVSCGQEVSGQCLQALGRYTCCQQ